MAVLPAAHLKRRFQNNSKRHGRIEYSDGDSKKKGLARGFMGRTHDPKDETVNAIIQKSIMRKNIMDLGPEKGRFGATLIRVLLIVRQARLGASCEVRDRAGQGLVTRHTTQHDTTLTNPNSFLHRILLKVLH